MATQVDSRGTDLVALFGAALAASVALIAGGGTFTALSTIVGLTLVSILAAYYRVRDWPRTWLEGVIKASALATVTALSVFLVVAFPLQQMFVRTAKVRVGARMVTLEQWCDVQVVNRFQRDIETCVGTQTSTRLWWIWLVSAVLIFVVALYFLLRNVNRGPLGLDVQQWRQRVDDVRGPAQRAARKRP